MKKCLVCEKEILNNRVYCSNSCKEKYRYKNTTYNKNCIICGKEICVTKGTSVCSKECYLKSQRNKVKTCPVCKSEFNSRGNGVYCSNMCYRIANNPKRGLKISNCEVCGGTFRSLKGYEELTCSDKCSSNLFYTYINRTNKCVFGTTNKRKIKNHLKARGVIYE